MTSLLYAVVPAAGVGARMQADRPKQYLVLQGKTILEHTLLKLLDFTAIEEIVLPVSSNDGYIKDLDIHRHDKVTLCEGGQERFHSVLNGLQTLLNKGVSRDAWVMVHDVARPCIRLEDLNHLYKNANKNGVILGMQVRDTMKRTKSNAQVTDTVDRTHLWHAQTPQLAPLGTLHDALSQSIQDGVPITDEASALEYIGIMPTMLAGHPSNIKITQPEDLEMARAFIQLNHSQNQIKSTE
jgi:2-C-methyl-D-erythritol 4-phosphate cytidylyltransferase